MPTPSSFDYAIVRVVPRVERQEFVNAGVILYCKDLRFLGAKVYLDERRLRALWPDADAGLIRQHLDAYARVCSGEPSGGPIARLAMRERFHWLVSPRSTMIQVSPVHAGLCDDPAAELEKLYSKLVAVTS